MAIPQDQTRAARVPRASIQDRTRAILRAAQVYKERYTVMADVFVLLHQMMREGAISPTEAMERFFNQLSAGTISIEAAGVIEAEQARYNLTRRRNDYMREYQRRRRAGAGAGAPCGAPSDTTSANAHAPCDDAMSRGASRAPSDAASANAMSLAEIEAALARVSRGVAAPSSNAAALRAPLPYDDASAAAAPSAAFDAELSADDLL